jgi:hypothetical protein
VSFFISYSRAQFYLAEDLALGLGQHGVNVWFDVHRLGPGDDWDSETVAALHACDGVVLVASRAALASAYVQAEIDLARKLGKPIVVALAERVDPPDGVDVEDCVDLRWGFEGKLRSLSAMLKRGSDAGALGRVRWSSRRRPAVARMVSVALLGAGALWVLPSLYGLLSRDDAFPPLAYLVSLAASLFSGWLWWAFSHRRSGWTVWLGAASAMTSLYVLALFGWSVHLAITTDVSGRWDVVIIISPLVILIVIGVWALCSPSFYRWLPTGDAPRWMRRRMHARRGRRPATDQQSGGVLITFDIRCHPYDAAVERALDGALHAQGHRREKANAERQLVVLSNLTPIDWLNETLAQLGERPVIVISAPVSLATVEHVGRYQWIDYRRRNPGTLRRLATSIGGATSSIGADLVPESLSRQVLPFAVLAVSAMYAISAAAGMSMGIAGLAGVDFAQSPSTSFVPLLGGLFALGAALTLAPRRIPPRGFLALAVAAFVSTAVTNTLVYTGLPTWTDLVTFGMVPVVLMVSWKTFVGWLPARVVRANVATLAVGKGLWWKAGASRTFALGTVAMGLVWLAIGLSPV